MSVQNYQKAGSCCVLSNDSETAIVVVAAERKKSFSFADKILDINPRLKKVKVPFIVTLRSVQ